ncbi:Os09g0431050, partial [Oryza sativa Japonica Group]
AGGRPVRRRVHVQVHDRPVPGVDAAGHRHPQPPRARRHHPPPRHHRRLPRPDHRRELAPATAANAEVPGQPAVLGPHGVAAHLGVLRVGGRVLGHEAAHPPPPDVAQPRRRRHVGGEADHPLRRVDGAEEAREPVGDDPREALAHHPGGLGGGEHAPGEVRARVQHEGARLQRLHPVHRGGDGVGVGPRRERAAVGDLGALGGERVDEERHEGGAVVVVLVDRHDAAPPEEPRERGDGARLRRCSCSSTPTRGNSS